MMTKGNVAKTTPATVFLKNNNIAYELLAYDFDQNVKNLGLQAAAAIGADPDQVFKTLMVKIDGKPFVAIIPANQTANMKKLASIFDCKHAEMMPIQEAEKITGYKVGGISPFGQRKILPTIFEESALNFEKIYLNGGGRGLQLKLDPLSAIAVLNAKTTILNR